MSECICNSCKNLKNTILDSGEAGEAACTYGFPSDKCEQCQDGECSEVCGHYEADSEEIVIHKVNCKKCGKQLEKVADNEDDGDVFCIDCYLNN